MRLAHFLAIALCLYSAPVRAEVPTVMTDIPPIHSLVAQVMGDLGDPILLLEPGGDAHDFQLRPSQASALADADVIFWIGPQLTPWLDRGLTITPDATSVPLLGMTGTVLRTYNNSGEPDHPEQSASGTPRTDGQHGHSEIDPHAWLDPTNAEIWLGRIADELAFLDPGNSITYRANASLGQAAIAALDTDLQQRLGSAKAVPVVVAHDSVGYFADHFGLSIAATVATGDAADPGAAHLSRIRAMLEKGDVACIFPEALGNPSRIAVLADGTGARIGDALDPEGRLLSPGPALYTELLTNLATAIADCVTQS
jgi:zinc transport system substrate-binding protein